MLVQLLRSIPFLLLLRWAQTLLTLSHIRPLFLHSALHLRLQQLILLKLCLTLLPLSQLLLLFELPPMLPLLLHPLSHLMLLLQLLPPLCTGLLHMAL